jgi:ParB family chromosome partitioning protein
MSDKAMKSRSRLGRGLSSLISISTPDEAPAQLPAVPTADVASAASAGPSDAGQPLPPGIHVLDVPLESIVANPHQPRRQFNEASLNELAASLKSTGMIQPIIVRPTGPDSYQLIAGERRWRAARLAELPTIPAILRDVDSATQAQMALIENIQREDLNPLDRAAAYKTLLTHLGLTQAELAGRMGEDRTTISHFLRLLDLPEDVQQMVRDGKLGHGHAKLLGSINDPAEQQRLADLVVAQHLSVRNLERLLSAPPAPAPAKREAISSGSAAHLQELERSLSRQLNLRVQVRAAAKKGQGRLVVHYSSLDQFDELMTRLGVQME